MGETFFIAGPMTGRRNFNFDAFDEAEVVLRAQLGGNILNPAKNHGGRQDLEWEQYLEESLRQVREEATVLVVLDGWMNSRGAKIEMDEALRKGIEIVSFEHLTGKKSPLNEPDESCVVPSATFDDAPPGSDQLHKRLGFEKWSDPLHERTLETPIPMTLSTTAEEFAAKNKEWLASQGGKPAYLKGLGLGDTQERPVVDRAWSMVVEGDRQAAYGHPNSDFTAKGRIDAAILGRWLESEGLKVVPVKEGEKKEVVYFPDIPPRISTLMMQSVKISRESAHPKQDNRDDGVGYWICTDRAAKAGTIDEY